MNDQWPSGAGEPADGSAGTSAEGAPIPYFGEVLRFSGRIMSASLGSIIPFLAVCLVIDTVLGGALVYYSTPENYLMVSLAQIVISVLFISPVVSMAGARLALSLWDGEPVNLSVFAVALSLYKDSLAIFLSYLAYLLMVALLATLVTMPMMMLITVAGNSAGAMQALLAIAAVVLGVWLIRLFVWGRARRIVPFLGDINCFMCLEGRTEGGWMANTGRWFARLNDDRYRLFLNGAMAFVIAVDVAKVAVFVAAGGLSPDESAAVGSFGASLLVGFFQTLALTWLAIAGAGFFRLALNSGRDMVEPGRSYGLH